MDARIEVQLPEAFGKRIELQVLKAAHDHIEAQIIALMRDLADVPHGFPVETSQTLTPPTNTPRRKSGRRPSAQSKAKAAEAKDFLIAICKALKLIGEPATASQTAKRMMVEMPAFEHAVEAHLARRVGSNFRFKTHLFAKTLNNRHTNTEEGKELIRQSRV